MVVRYAVTKLGFPLDDIIMYGWSIGEYIIMYGWWFGQWAGSAGALSQLSIMTF